METSTLHHSIPAVAITPRSCLGQPTVSVPATTGATLTSLLPSGIPEGALTCEIQADGGTIRLALAGDMVTPTSGFCLYDGATRLIDSELAAVTLVAVGASGVQAVLAFFDRV